MDYHLNGKGTTKIESYRSKNIWTMPSDDTMNHNDEFFSWPSSLKIDEEKYGNGPEDNKVSRKRKLSNSFEESTNKSKGGNVAVDPLQNGGTGKAGEMKKPNGTTRMPQWQVEDISDLNADIEESLNIGAEIANNSYNMSDAILSISGLTVFKQEAPSPTSHDALQIPRQTNHQSPTSTQGHITTSTGLDDSNSSQNMINSTLHQLLGQQGYSTLQNAIEGNLITSSTHLSQDSYNIAPNSCIFAEDCRFQYVLAAATSIATKINEDTLTYLNQGQSYEIKLKKLGDLSKYRGKMLKSIIRICFHERRLQYMEREQMLLWQRARPGDRILEVDVPLSYGLYDVVQSSNMLNAIQFNWDPTKEVGAYIKVNCISTEFTPKKHGGEKGVPFRIQVETYQNDHSNSEQWKRLHTAACQIKVFKLKGADRKHKQDREKILKRPLSEQEKYQPSYECTVLNDIPNDAVSSVSSPTRSFSPDSGTQNTQNRNSQIKGQLLESLEEDENEQPSKSNSLNTDTGHREVVEKNVSIAESSLASNAPPQQTANWLTANRFGKYLDMFANFCGADLLRMSREDLIQICGKADGIRLYNALNSKMIAPKLTIYVRQENTNVFNAIFLSSFSYLELLTKLALLQGVPPDHVKNIYMQGPQSIHVKLDNDVLKHIKEDMLFSFDILEESARYIFVLKPASK